MVTFLLIIIYVVFIGLGIPDSIFGAAWPAIYPEFNQPVGNASFITMMLSLGTALASFFSAKLINKFGTGPVTAFSTALTALALLGFALSPSFEWFFLFSLPLGFGAGAIDSALNNYVAVHYNSSHMSFLHCFYGLGVAISPYVLSFALSSLRGWRLGYMAVFYIQAGITTLSLIALPLWEKVKQKEPIKQEVKPITLSIKQMAKMPAVRMAWLLFFSTCALEFTCGIWGCTYLVLGQGFSEANAAKFLTLYYIGIMAGRFISGLISSKIPAMKIVYVGYSLVGVALLVMVLPLPATVKGLSLFLIGFGNGPTFPNLTYLTPINFGKDISQSIIGTQMVVCNLGICFMPPIFGLLAQNVSIFLFPPFLIAMYALMVVSTIFYDKLPKQKSSDLTFD